MFGREVPINTTPIKSGIAGTIKANLKKPASASPPNKIPPPKLPTAIALARYPIAFGTSFDSLISRIRIYGAAVNAPCAAPSSRRKIANGRIECTRLMPIPHAAQMIPEITTIFLLPNKSPSFPPIGVIIANPSDAKIVSRE